MTDCLRKYRFILFITNHFAWRRSYCTISRGKAFYHVSFTVSTMKKRKMSLSETKEKALRWNSSFWILTLTIHSVIDKRRHKCRNKISVLFYYAIYDITKSYQYVINRYTCRS